MTGSFLSCCSLRGELLVMAMWGSVMQEGEAGHCPKWKSITGCTTCIRVTELTGSPSWWECVRASLGVGWLIVQDSEAVAPWSYWVCPIEDLQEDIRMSEPRIKFIVCTAGCTWRVTLSGGAIDVTPVSEAEVPELNSNNLEVPVWWDTILEGHHREGSWYHLIVIEYISKCSEVYMIPNWGPWIQEWPWGTSMMGHHSRASPYTPQPFSESERGN